MKKGLTELVFILDRSGSMAGLEQDTIGGFNAMIEKQKKTEGEAYVSTVLFSNESVVIHDRADVQTIAPMTGEDYQGRLHGACGRHRSGHPSHWKRAQVRARGRPASRHPHRSPRGPRTADRACPARGGGR